MSSAHKLLEVAKKEIGYLEKKTNSNLDSKTANAGYNNFTKYARDLDNILNFYNGKKNGYAWCDMFVDWCFVQAFGLEEAMRLLGQPYKSAGAGCTYSAQYYKKLGRFHTKNPKAGDQIFFGSSMNNCTHTGIVSKVDNTKVYTIEGNTSSSAGVVANGGGVFEKSYSLSNSKIVGYGRPDYNEEEEDMVRYNTLQEIPAYAKDSVQKLMNAGILQGKGNSLDLSDDMLRCLVILCRIIDKAGIDI